MLRHEKRENRWRILRSEAFLTICWLIKRNKEQLEFKVVRGFKGRQGLKGMHLCRNKGRFENFTGI
jgi:hypothetical protein